MAAYAVTTIDALPSIDDEGVDWRPIQHYFGLSAFGINVCRAAAGTHLIADHDERTGDHEEIYLVLEGEVEFTVGEETFDCARGGLVVVKNPAVRRRGVAKGPAVVLALGAPRRERFESTWRPDHFAGVPTYDEVSKG
jgi:hypothetical protein